MSLDKVVELIYTLVILLFLVTIVLAILITFFIMEEMTNLNIDFKFKIIFIGGMFAVFIYIMKMIVDKIKEYNRCI